MIHAVKEQVAMVTIYEPSKKVPLPWRMRWKNREYTFSKVDLCHPYWEGKTMVHVFSVCDGSTYFRLEFNTRSQHWILMETSDGLPD